MKPILAFLLCVLLVSIVFIAESQIVSFNESTTLLSKPHGKPIFQVSKGVEYWSIKCEKDTAWTKIIVPCFVKQTVIQNKELPNQAVLYNCNSDSIGFSLQKIKIDTFQHHNCTNLFNSPEYKFADLAGYIETAQIPEIYSIAELQKKPDSFSDSCVSRIYKAVNTEGVDITVNEDCRLYFETLLIDNNLECVLIKELKTTTSYFTVDTKDVTMKLSIIRNYDSDQPEIHEITSDSYECEFKDNTIIFTESKWYSPAFYHMYSPLTYKELMKYQDCLYTLEIPNSIPNRTNRKAFIGYFINFKNRNQNFNSTITLTDGQSVLIQKNILCTSPELTDRMYCCTSKLEFIPVHPEDKVLGQNPPRLLLKSKTGNHNADCFSGFRIKLYLVSLGEEISIELEFRDGDIFLVKNYQDAFELR